ncbi:hypothetical protein BDW60DRAFT_198047 [Aspergillus nidulans var. acristatus]
MHPYQAYSIITSQWPPKEPAPRYLKTLSPAHILPFRSRHSYTPRFNRPQSLEIPPPSPHLLACRCLPWTNNYAT